MHALPQATRPAAQEKAQLAPEQLATPPLGLAHRLPQAPQWAGDACASTQAPPQFSLLAPQLSLHTPSEQTVPGAQGWLHPPQCVGSLVTSTHVPLQASNGRRHATVQLPATQATSAPTASAQAWPQAPQLSASLATSTQPEPQGTNPFAHAKVHELSKQTPEPLTGELQMAPQPPQFLASLLTVTQVLPQVVSPLAQAGLGPGSTPERPCAPGRTQRLVDASQT